MLQNILNNAQDSPRNRIIWLQMSVVPRLGNLATEEDPRSRNINTNWTLNSAFGLLLIIYFHFYIKKKIFFPRPPFTAFNQKELAGKIREGKFRRIPYRYSDELNDIITRMLNLKVKFIRWYIVCFHLSVKFCSVCSRGAMSLKKH